MRCDIMSAEETTMTLTLELPDEIAARLSATYPDEVERNRALLCSIVDTIEAEQRDKAEMIEVIHAELANIEAGSKSYTLEEMRQHWDEMRADARYNEDN